MGVALGAGVLLVPLVMKGVINRVDGAIMVVAYLVYLAMQYYWGA